MKTKIMMYSLALLMSLCGMMGCRRAGCDDINACNYDPKVKMNDGSCIGKGNVIFWQSTVGDDYDIVVTVNGSEATITTQMATMPLCGASGGASFSLCPGTYHYEAHEQFPGIESWDGSIMINEDGCSTVQLE